MRYKPIVVLFMVAGLLICVSSAAHAGRTDSNGGHRDSSTGEYHYHHGYPAHQHENGICPYDYDDKTGVNSGSSSHSESDDAVAEPVENKSYSSALYLLGGAAGVSLLYASNKKRSGKQVAPNGTNK